MRRPTPHLLPAPSPALGRRSLTVALCAGQLLAGACTAHRPVGPGAEPLHTAVRVRLAAPRSVVAVAANGDTLVDRGATEVEGVLAEARRDTLVLRGRALTPAIVRMAGVSGRHERQVRIVRQVGDHVEVRRFSPGRTAGLVLGGAAAAGVAFVAALAGAYANCSPYCG